jgi:hypothetical protein
MRELSGSTTASFRLWDGSSNAGALLAPFNLNANESVREWPGPHSLTYEIGLYLEVISGSFEATFQVISADEWDCGVPTVAFVIGEVDVNL